MLIGIASEILGDAFFIPGYGRSYGVFVHAIGAETLKHGQPIDLGWIPGFLVAFAAVSIALLRKRFVETLAAFSVASGLLIAAPVFMEANLIVADVTPGLFVLLTVATVLGWRRYRARPNSFASA